MNQANWNDILGKAKEFGKAVGDVAGEVVDASRQKLDEMKKRRELEECYLKLGHMYYALLQDGTCLLYTSPSPRDYGRSRMPSSA